MSAPGTTVVPFASKAGLATLADTINAEHTATTMTAMCTVEHAIRCGQALLAAKALLVHGTWLPWLRSNCPTVSDRTAQVYMRVAKAPPPIGTTTLDAALKSIANKATTKSAEPALLPQTKRNEEPLTKAALREQLLARKDAEHFLQALETRLSTAVHMWENTPRIRSGIAHVPIEDRARAVKAARNGIARLRKIIKMIEAGE